MLYVKIRHLLMLCLCVQLFLWHCVKWRGTVSDSSSVLYITKYLCRLVNNGVSVNHCHTKFNLQRNPVSNVELSLVIFNSHGSYCGMYCALLLLYPLSKYKTFYCALFPGLFFPFNSDYFLLLSVLGSTEWLDERC